MESFEGPDILYNDTSILREQREQFNQQPIFLWPSLFINNHFYRGDLYIDNVTDMSEILLRNISNYAVLEAVCAGYNDDHLPDLCDNKKMIEVTKGGDVV